MFRRLSRDILTILLLLSAGQLWAEDSAGNGAIDSGAEQPSNMESWQEEWRNDDKGGEWTWFGMGYESRRASSGSQGGGSTNGSTRGQNGNGSGRGGGGGGH